MLEKTLGVPLFQEQAMRVAIECAGFAASEAGLLRRAISTFQPTGGVSHFRDRRIKGTRRTNGAIKLKEPIGTILPAEAEDQFLLPQTTLISQRDSQTDASGRPRAYQSAALLLNEIRDDIIDSISDHTQIIRIENSVAAAGLAERPVIKPGFQVNVVPTALGCPRRIFSLGSACSFRSTGALCVYDSEIALQQGDFMFHGADLDGA